MPYPAPTLAPIATPTVKPPVQAAATKPAGAPMLSPAAPAAATCTPGYVYSPHHAPMGDPLGFGVKPTPARAGTAPHAPMIGPPAAAGAASASPSLVDAAATAQSVSGTASGIVSAGVAVADGLTPAAKPAIPAPGAPAAAEPAAHGAPKGPSLIDKIGGAFGVGSGVLQGVNGLVETVTGAQQAQKPGATAQDQTAGGRNVVGGVGDTAAGAAGVVNGVRALRGLESNPLLSMAAAIPDVLRAGYDLVTHAAEGQTVNSVGQASESTVLAGASTFLGPMGAAAAAETGAVEGVINAVPGMIPKNAPTSVGQTLAEGADIQSHLGARTVPTIMANMANDPRATDASASPVANEAGWAARSIGELGLLADYGLNTLLGRRDQSEIMQMNPQHTTAAAPPVAPPTPTWNGAAPAAIAPAPNNPALSIAQFLPQPKERPHADAAQTLSPTLSPNLSANAPVLQIGSFNGSGSSGG